MERMLERHPHCQIKRERVAFKSPRFSIMASCAWAASWLTHVIDIAITLVVWRTAVKISEGASNNQSFDDLLDSILAE